MEELGLPTHTIEALGEHPVYTVSDLTRLIKEALERDQRFRAVLVKGEISNFKHHSSGHMYFTLKDDEEPAEVRHVSAGRTRPFVSGPRMV